MAPKSLKLLGNSEELRAAFLDLSSPRGIAELLEVPYPTLTFYLYKKKNNYKRFELQRASGKPRVIYSPISSLKIVQRKLAQVLYAVYGSRSVVHGFVKGRSIRSNAVRHLGAEWVLNFDLEDFFPTIHFGRVLGLFAGKPYSLSADVAGTLARICCHDGALPIGAPTSPIVSNMICAKMDSELKALAWSCGCTYTRYADDISISTRAIAFDKRVAEKNPTSRKWEIGPAIQEIIEKNSFKINESKTRVRGRQSSLEITGVRINSGPNVSSRLYRQVRAMLNAWEKYGEEAAQAEHRTKHEKKQRDKGSGSFRDILRGKIEFIGFIRRRDDRIYVKLLQRLQLLAGVKATPILIGPSTHESVIRQAIWLLRDKIDGFQGTAFAVQGNRLLTAAHNADHAMWASRPRHDKSEYEAKVVYRNDVLDVALLEIGAPLPVQFGLAQPSEISLNTRVCILGFPNYHEKDSVAFRFGSTVQERWYVAGTFEKPELVMHFIVDADIVKGNSGGPVLDGKNRVIGVAVKGIDTPGLLYEGDELSSFVPIHSSLIPPFPEAVQPPAPPIAPSDLDGD